MNGGEARPLMVTFVFYVSHLAPDVTEEMLERVRLTIFLAQPALSRS